MFAGRLTQTTLRILDWLAPKHPDRKNIPEHLQTGRRGEEDAYFYLRRRGYTMIARNYRSPQHRGELDMVGWDGDVLCFVEVKTRTTRAVKPAEAAVDPDKQRDLQLVARDFLRQMPASSDRDPRTARFSPDGPECRFDIVAVYYDRGVSQPSFELFQNAFSVAYNPSSYKRRFARWR